MSRRLWIAVLLSSGLAGGAAQAADIAPLGYDWTGFYIGAQVGYGWGETTYSYTDSVEPDAVVALIAVPPPPPPPEPFRSSVDLDFDGIVGGGTIGYNWQHDSIVLGVEADLSFSGMDSDRVVVDRPPCVIAGDGCSASIDWFGTGRLRLGYAIDNVMPFLTGGVAAVGVEGDADKGACGGSCDFDETLWGWTIGGGVEWGINERWSAKAEYLYVDVGSPDFSGGPYSGDVSADDFSFNVVRVGVNYRFY